MQKDNMDSIRQHVLTQWLWLKYVFEQICIAKAHAVQTNVALDTGW